jgi:hypothetical protein
VAPKPQVPFLLQSLASVQMRKPCDTAEGQSLKIAGPSKRICLFGCVGVQEGAAPVEAKLGCLHCDKIRGVLRKMA